MSMNNADGRGVAPEYYSYNATRSSKLALAFTTPDTSAQGGKHIAGNIKHRHRGNQNGKKANVWLPNKKARSLPFIASRGPTRPDCSIDSLTWF